MSFWEAMTDRVKTVYKVVVHDPRIQEDPPPKMPAEMDYVDLYNFADYYGFTRFPETEYLAQEARETLANILASAESAVVKYDALHMLDIRVQNQTLTECLAVERDILAAQYRLIQQMEAESGS